MGCLFFLRLAISNWDTLGLKRLTKTLDGLALRFWFTAEAQGSFWVFGSLLGHRVLLVFRFTEGRRSARGFWSAGIQSVCL